MLTQLGQSQYDAQLTRSIIESQHKKDKPRKTYLDTSTNVYHMTSVHR